MNIKSLLSKWRGKAAPIGPIEQLGVKITLKHEDMPKFRREYQVDIEGGFTVKVELYSYVFGRYDSSSVTQKDGRWITFDVHKVADKIIDRELYPHVQAAADQILALDKAFIAQKPDRFTDETGAIWTRGR